MSPGATEEESTKAGAYFGAAVVLADFKEEAVKAAAKELVALVIPVFVIYGQHALLYFAPAASLVICFLFAFWVGQRLESRFILHGMLVGLVATLLYVGLARARPEPLAYLASHGLKILGGAGGGLVAARRRAATTATGKPADWSCLCGTCSAVSQSGRATTN
jgi:hypothetical protein